MYIKWWALRRKRADPPGREVVSREAARGTSRSIMLHRRLLPSRARRRGHPHLSQRCADIRPQLRLPRLSGGRNRFFDRVKVINVSDLGHFVSYAAYQQSSCCHFFALAFFRRQTVDRGHKPCVRFQVYWPVFYFRTGRVRTEEVIAFPILRWSDGPRNKTAAAIGANIFQNGIHTSGAESTFISTDACLK